MVWKALYLCRKGGYLSQGETGSHSVSVPTSSSCVAIGNGNIGMLQNLVLDYFVD